MSDEEATETEATTEDFKHWLGKPLDDWRAMWNDVGWKLIVERTFMQVANNSQAAPEDRMGALSMWKAAMVEGILAVNSDYPEIMKSVLIDIANGTRWTIDEAERKRTAEKLYGARVLLNTAAQFFNRPGDREVQPEVPVGQIPS